MLVSVRILSRLVVVVSAVGRLGIVCPLLSIEIVIVVVVVQSYSENRLEFDTTFLKTPPKT